MKSQKLFIKVIVLSLLLGLVLLVFADARAQGTCPTSGTYGKDVDRNFFSQVVGRLKDVPQSNFAVEALMAWKPYENTRAYWNPLATTWKMNPVCNFNTVGVQNYIDQDTGVRATANTLNLSYYNSIRKMLRLDAFDREAMRSSLGTWGTCSGSGCNSLLTTWENLYNRYKGGGGSGGGGGGGCSPNADQIALFVDAGYNGQCVIKGSGSYSNPGSIGLPNDSISSIKVGSNAKATLCRDDNYGGGCETFTGNDSNLSDNGIGNDQVSSAKVESRNSGGGGGGGGSGSLDGFIYCAREDQWCSFSGTRTVAYGANGRFSYKYGVTGGISCNNSTFGDPIYGVVKACYVK